MRDANFLVVRVRQWCWPKMSLHLPYAYAFLQSMPNCRKNNDRTDYFVFVRTRDDNLRRKHQRMRIKPSIFQKGSKKNPRRLNRGNSTVRSFRKQKTVESFCMFIHLTKKHFDRESKHPKQKRIKSKPIQQKNSIKSNISYPNLKNGGKKTMYGAQSMRCLPFCLFLCFFLRVPGLILSLFHRLSLFHHLSISDPKYQSVNQNQI